jgi:hypothetical protein
MFAAGRQVALGAAPLSSSMPGTKTIALGAIAWTQSRIAAGWRQDTSPHLANS